MDTQDKKSEFSAREQIRERLQAINVVRQPITEPAKSGISERSIISMKEYEKRLLEEERRNSPLVKANRHAQIEALEAEWKNRIEDRWREASIRTINPNHVPVLEDRINRHATRDGMNRTSLVLTGDLGRGKTWLAYAYAYELIHRGLLLPSQIFIDTERTLGSISNSGFEKAHRMEALLNPHYRFFLIDDVGRGVFSTPFMRGEIWYELINYVYSRRLTLVLTTNLISSRKSDEKNTLAQWLGEAAVSRLRHIVGGDGNIVIAGDDMRKKEGERWESEYLARNN